VISWIDRLVIISKCFQRKRAFASFIRQSKWNNRKWAFHTVFLTRFLKKKETTKGIVQANRQSNSQVSFFSQSILSLLTSFFQSFTKMVPTEKRKGNVCMMMMMMRTLSDLIGSWLERFLFFWVAAVLLHRF